MSSLNPVWLAFLLLISCFGLHGLGELLRYVLPFGLLKEKRLTGFHGLLFSVAATAIICTEGQTIMCILLLYFIFQIIAGEQERRNFNLIEYFRSVGFACFFSLLPFITFCLLHFRGNETFTLPFMDEVFYAKVSSLLLYNGVETNLTQMLWFPQFSQTTPYHFFEIWLTGLLGFVLQISPILAYKFIAIPLIMGISGYVLMEIARAYDLKRAASVLAVCLCFCTGLFFGYEVLMDSPLPQTVSVQLHYISDFIPLNRTKLATVLLFFSVFALLWKEKNKQVFFPLICLAFLWISLTPSLAFFLVVIGVFIRAAHGIRNLPLVFFGLLSAIFFYAFYFSPWSNTFFDNSMHFLKYRSPNILVGTLVYEALSHFIILLPLILFILYSYLTHYVQVDFKILFLFVPIGIGIILHAITIGSVDSFQFVSNISGILLPLLFFCGYVFYFKNKFRWEVKVFFWLMVLGQFYFSFRTLRYSFNNYRETYSKSFLNQSSDLLKKTGKTVVSFSFAKGGHSDAPFTNYEGAFFLLADSKVRIAQLNADKNEKEIDEKGFDAKIKSAPFLYFLNKHQMQDAKAGRIAFLKAFKPDFLVVNRQIAMSDYPELKPFLKQVLVDRESKTRIFQIQLSKEKHHE